MGLKFDAAAEKEKALEQHEFETEDDIINYLSEHSNGKLEYLVRGATLECRFGSAPRKLNLTKDHAVYITTHPAVHWLNCETGEGHNIPPFGVCKATGNSCKASIEIVGEKWLETYPNSRIVDNGEKNPVDRDKARLMRDKSDNNQDINDSDMPNGEDTLTTLSFLVCVMGGLIEPKDSGQNPEGEPDHQEEQVLLTDSGDEGASGDAPEEESADEEIASEKNASVDNNLANSVIDENGTYFYVGPTYVGNRSGGPYDGRGNSVSNDYLEFTKKMCEVSNVDYPLALAIMLHETTFDAQSHKITNERNGYGWELNPWNQKIERQGYAMGICQIMPSIYDYFVWNEYTKAVERGDPDFEPPYANNWTDIREFAEKNYDIDWNDPYNSYTNLAVEMCIYNQARLERGDDPYTILKNIAGFGENASPKEIIYYRNEIAKQIGEPLWVEGIDYSYEE